MLKYAISTPQTPRLSSSPDTHFDMHQVTLSKLAKVFFALCHPPIFKSSKSCSMNIAGRPNKSKTKVFYFVEWGRGTGQRQSLDMFTFTKPRTQTEKNHNKEINNLIAIKKSELLLEQQAIGSGYIPPHKFKSNFLDYYDEYVKNNKIDGNRHLSNSLAQFRVFIKKTFVSPVEITEELTTRFRQFLLRKFSGDTPANYFAKYKKVIKAATKAGYFRINPAEDIKAKSSPTKYIKEHLEADEYIKLLKTPCLNQEIKEAFILSCYTALRWCDVKPLDWTDIKGDQLKTRLIQKKTGEPIWITLHPIARAILERRKSRLPEGVTTGRVFNLPSHDGANKLLGQWCRDAGIDKHITWHCARLSFSILLQDARVDNATVALLLGHTSTKYVDKTYKRHRPKDQSVAINQLPMPNDNLYFIEINKEFLNN
ncbi:MAG: hypothetical protein E6Q24_01360 [Chitinophagaceae bacterium]|nr:MAG: hypothetical protein E6Q24_01360 [Chitinophagaceae bacterium]